MFEYKTLLETVRNEGQSVEGRNGKTTMVFGKQLEIDSLLFNLFPIITGRQIFYKGVVGEMAAFLKGPKQLFDFTDQGCNYWKDWAKPDGSINVDYGNKWLDFNGVNQLERLVNDIKQNPSSRRHILSSWDPSTCDTVDLPCCHYAYQFNKIGNQLDLIWIQRSVDLFVGLPSDIILAALMLILMANATDSVPGRITMQLGNCHIYENQEHAVDQYLKAHDFILPSYRCVGNILDFEPQQFELFNYVHSPRIDSIINV